jgi:hypothetical protein
MERHLRPTTIRFEIVPRVTGTINQATCRVLLKASMSLGQQESFSRILPGMAEKAAENKTLEDAKIIVTPLTYVIVRLKQMHM